MSAVHDDLERLGQLYGAPRTEQRLETLRVPPHNVEAEQSVLGALMFTPAALPKVADWLAEEDFYRRDHRLIYRAIRELAQQGKPVDVVTLGEWLEAQGLGEQVGGTGYLVDLANTTPSAANVVAYAEIVAERAALRRTIEAGMALVDQAYAPGATAEAVSAAAQAALANLVPVKHTGLTPGRAVLKSWFDGVLERVDRPGLLGLPTPWMELNRITRGLRPGRVYVLAARPGMGKSILGGQLSAFTALRGDRTALFSMEMSAEEIHQRNVSALAGVPHDFLDQPESDSDYWPALNAAIARLSPAPLLIDDTPGLTSRQLVARAERAHLQAPLRLVVVDHLHEMTVDPRDRVNGIGQVMRDLKGLAKRLDVAVVVLAQLNRAGQRADDKRPTLVDLRASGSIEEVADVVLLVHREDYYHRDTHLQGVIEIDVAKGRNIRSGETIYLRNRYSEMRADDWSGPLPTAPAPAKKKAAASVGFDGPDAQSRAAGDL